MIQLVIGGLESTIPNYTVNIRMFIVIDALWSIKKGISLIASSFFILYTVCRIYLVIGIRRILLYFIERSK